MLDGFRIFCVFFNFTHFCVRLDVGFCVYEHVFLCHFGGALACCGADDPLQFF